MAALKIEKDNAYGNKKYIVASGIVLASLPLVIFKYYNFLSSQLGVALSFMGLEIGLPGLNWAMPLGISFFTLQAIGYLADVYLKRIKADLIAYKIQNDKRKYHKHCTRVVHHGYKARAYKVH